MSVSTTATHPQITHSDRFAFTVCLAIILHAIVILGVTFVAEENYQPRFDSMDIILVQQADQESPDEAHLLTQADNRGGGHIEDPITPSPPPFPPPFLDNVPEITAPPIPHISPEPATTESVEDQELIQEPERKVEQLIVQSDIAKDNAQQETIEKPEALIEGSAPAPRKSATELLTNSFKIASLSARIDSKLEARSKQPRRRFISASTRTYKYASYMEAWRAKVERVGNLNYPEEARKLKISGSLILDVALNPDGNINQITIRRSSGHKILDESAIRIVELASPFSPFPDNISGETDILHITRTWQFLNNSLR